MLGRGAAYLAKETAKVGAVVFSTALAYAGVATALEHAAHLSQDQSAAYAFPILLIGPLTGWIYMYRKYGFLGLPPSRKDRR